MRCNLSVLAMLSLTVMACGGEPIDIRPDISEPIDAHGKPNPGEEQGSSCDYSIDASDEDITIPNNVSVIRVTGNHTAQRTYTLPEPLFAGQVMTISKTNGWAGNNNIVYIKRLDGVCLARFQDVQNLFGWRGWVQVKMLPHTGKWHAISFGGAIEVDDDGC